MPAIQHTASYIVYIYCPKLQHIATATKVSINNGSKVINTTINNNDVNVTGQTSGEWVLLTAASFSAGKKVSITVANEGADGTVVADAVLLVPVR